MWIQQNKLCGISLSQSLSLRCLGMMSAKPFLTKYPMMSYCDVTFKNFPCLMMSYCDVTFKNLSEIFLVLWCLTVMSPSKICQKLFVLWCLTVMSPSKICQKSLKFSQLQLDLIQWEAGLFSWFFLEKSKLYHH